MRRVLLYDRRDGSCRVQTSEFRTVGAQELSDGSWMLCETASLRFAKWLAGVFCLDLEEVEARP